MIIPHLFTLQKRAIRNILNKRRYSYIPSLFVNLKFLTLYDINYMQIDCKLCTAGLFANTPCTFKDLFLSVVTRIVIQPWQVYSSCLVWSCFILIIILDKSLVCNGGPTFTKLCTAFGGFLQSSFTLLFCI